MISADTLLARAEKLLKEKKYTELTSVCSQILEKEEDNEFALHQMGKSFYYRGKYDESEKYLEKASYKHVKEFKFLSPAECDIIFDYGKCLLKNDKLDKALSVYDKFLEVDELQASMLREDYYKNLAMICFYNRNTADAIKCLDYYLKHYPECQRLINSKIELLLSTNKLDDVKEIYDEKMVMEVYERIRKRFFIGIYDIDIIDSTIDDETLSLLAESLDLHLNINNLIDRWYIYSYTYALNNELDEKMAESYANVITWIFTNCNMGGHDGKYYDEDKIIERIYEMHGRYNDTGNEKDKAKVLVDDVLHIYKDNFEAYSMKTEKLVLDLSYSLYEKFMNVPGEDEESKFNKILYDFYENRKSGYHDKYSDVCKHVLYSFRDKMVWKKLYSEDGGQVLYEGFTLNSKPCGLGTEYDINGRKYREGLFDIKGLVQGKEYYPNGQVRFEGTYQINRSYGPNYPSHGNYYGEDGKLLFTGKFKISKSNVGIPRVLIPRNYGNLLNDSSSITYLMWQDVRNI